MHIPDGALSPATYGAAYAVMVPIWVIAGRRVQRTLTARTAPLLAIGAAFSFLVMMFDVPAVGTTGHATGAPLLAILLGPWAATLALSVVLAVQAFVFADGGITALGANCFNLGFLISFASYGVFRLTAGRMAAGSRRSIIAAGVAGYVGINVAAFSTAVMLGIQPQLAHAPDGRPLYFPLGLRASVAALGIPHLLVFGFLEAAVTALAYGYLARIEAPRMAGTRG